MKKLLSIFIVISILVLSTFNVSATNITSSEKLPTKLRFDMETRTVQEVDDVKTSRIESYTTRTSDSGYSPEYSVDVLDGVSTNNNHYNNFR